MEEYVLRFRGGTAPNEQVEAIRQRVEVLDASPKQLLIRAESIEQLLLDFPQWESYEVVEVELPPVSPAPLFLEPKASAALKSKEGERLVSELVDETGMTVDSVLRYVDRYEASGPGPAMRRLVEFLIDKSELDRSGIELSIIHNSIWVASKLAEIVELSSGPDLPIN